MNVQVTGRQGVTLDSRATINQIKPMMSTYQTEESQVEVIDQSVSLNYFVKVRIINIKE